MDVSLPHDSLPGDLIPTALIPYDVGIVLTERLAAREVLTVNFQTHYIEVLT
jgi:hypothetical protein